MSLAGPALAGGTAACIALVEMCAARRKAPTWRAAHWILIRLGLDAGAAALAYPIVLLVVRTPPWFRGPWPIAVAGAAGYAILRGQFAVQTGQQKHALVRLASTYRRVTRPI